MATDFTKNSATEVIFIGLPGITHHYGGLSLDNMASDKNRGRESNPKLAALQVLVLIRYLRYLGVNVAIIPPQLRPFLPALYEAGFNLNNVPLTILEQVSSSSFMWAANAATVTPLYDSEDNKLHITTANLHTNPHRRIEAQATYSFLKQVFSKVPYSLVSPPLAAGQGFLDEGAANHMRLSPNHAACGLNVFVYGKRQNLQASQQIAKEHHIPSAHTLFLEQNPEVIRQGVFHNDVIAVSNENLLLVHERAYKNGVDDIKLIEENYNRLNRSDCLQAIIINEDDLSVEESVGSYFFNSQIISKKNGKMAIIAPQEVKELYSGKALRLLEKICSDPNNSIDEIKTLDLRQSMQNGGGPACLRLRVVLSQEQLAAISHETNIIADGNLLVALEKIIDRYYPDSLTPEGLRGEDLYNKGKQFLSELYNIINIPN